MRVCAQILMAHLRKQAGTEPDTACRTEACFTMQSLPPPNQPPNQQPYPYYLLPLSPQPQQASRKGSAVPLVAIVLAVLAGVLVLCCAAGANAAALFPSSRAQVIPTATTQPIISTQPITAPTTPTLGGTMADFQQRYGPTTDRSV